MFLINNVALGIKTIELYENKYDNLPIGVNVNDKIKNIDDIVSNLNNI